MKRILYLLLFGAAVSVAKAQTGGMSPGTSGLQTPFQAKQSALQSSLSLFASHNFAAAESTLEAANIAAINTPDWHFESGADLLSVAALFHAAGDAGICGSVVNLAIGHLLQADQLYAGNGSPTTIASEKTTIGYIYERYLGNYAAAGRYYQAALTADPGYPQAVAALAHIEQAQAMLQQRFGAGVNAGN